MNQKVKNWEKELKHHPKRKHTKRRRKLKKLTRKLHHSSINLLNKICFWWKLSCDNNDQTILEIFKANNAVYHHNCIWNNQQKLKRSLEKRKRDDDKKKEAKANKWSKEEISKRKHQSFWEGRKCLFCGGADDVSILCADGTQDAASK